MEAKEKEILNEVISGTKCQFVIPVFQRNYDWGEKDCKRLFDDIIELAQNEEDFSKKHFIGAFVYKFNKIVETSFNEYILIDGQQRLTSLTLLLKALHDYLDKVEENSKELQSEIYETYLINKFAKKENFKLKLKPNKVDNQNFNLLMDNKFEDIEVTSNIYRNYKFFLKSFENLDVDISSFYNAMQRVEGVSVVLDDKDNPQVIFESLNSTGLDLSDIDLIRNYLLMNVDTKEQTRLYENYWIKMEEMLDESFTQFVRDYLSMKNSLVTPSSKNKIYKTFQKYYDNLNITIEELLDQLLKAARVYYRLLKPINKNTDLNNVLNDYIKLGIKTTYPFLLALLIDNDDEVFEKKKISDSELANIVGLLESYIIRRNVCNLAGGGLSQLMAQMYNTLKDKYEEDFYSDTYIKISMHLAGVTTKAYLPKNEEFIREFLERDMYKNRNLRFILEKFEKFNQSKEIVDFSSLSIEHIMPQTLNDEWRRSLETEEESPEEFHEEYKNTIGNLTLTAYNSEMSNKPFNKKAKHTEFSRLNLNSDIKSYTHWGRKEIEERALKLKDMALKLWAYPAISNIESISSYKIALLQDDDFDYSGTIPKGIEIKNKNFLANSWTKLYMETIKHFYNLDKTLLLSLLEKEEFANSDKPVISKHSTDLRNPKKLHKRTSLYIETNFNTERKMQILKEISKLYRFEDNDIVIFID